MQTQPARPSAKRLLIQGLIALAIAAISFTGLMLVSTQANQLEDISATDLSDPQPNTPVTCNDQPMTTDEICEHSLTINDNTSALKTRYTYEEQQVYQKEGRINALAAKKNAAIGEQRDQYDTTGSVISCVWLISFVTAIVLLARSWRTSRQEKVSVKAQI